MCRSVFMKPLTRGDVSVSLYRPGFCCRANMGGYARLWNPWGREWIWLNKQWYLPHCQIFHNSTSIEPKRLSSPMSLSQNSLLYANIDPNQNEKLGQEPMSSPHTRSTATSSPPKLPRYVRLSIDEEGARRQTSDAWSVQSNCPATVSRASCSNSNILRITPISFQPFVLLDTRGCTAPIYESASRESSPNIITGAEYWVNRIESLQKSIGCFNKTFCP